MAENLRIIPRQRLYLEQEPIKKPEIISGKYQGSKVLVVYGSGHAVKSGLIEEVNRVPEKCRV